MEAHFAKMQEAAWKDNIERAFGNLQARFEIVRGLTKFGITRLFITSSLQFDNVSSRVKPARNHNRIKAFLETYKQIEDSDKHMQLRDDLVKRH
jgi:hypothetical protein